jgi:hypothetical protein
MPPPPPPPPQGTSRAGTAARSQGPPPPLTLGHAVVHAVLAGQRLDEVLEGEVAAHIV